jgi:hypothetical protein
MADIVSSLFGLPRQEIEQQARARDLELGSLYGNAIINPYGDPQAQQMLAKQQASQFALGGALTRGLGGMFGLQTPELKRATDYESILQSTQQELGEEVNNPAALYPALQQKLAQAGFTREAMQVGMVGQKAMQESGLNQAKITNELTQAQKFKAEALKALREDDPAQKLFFEMAKNATPQSVAKAINAGYDLSVLDSPEKTKYSPLAQQLIDAGYEYGSPQFNAKMIEFLEAEKSGKSKGSGNVSVSLGGIAIDSGKVAEEAGKAVGKDVAAIENKYAAIDSVEDALSMVDAGINAGFYGPTKQFVSKATGGLVGSQAKVENTERFLSYVGNVVIPRLQEFGGNDSVEELKYLRQVMAGEITLEPNSIRRILQDADKKIKRGIERTQRQVQSASEGTPAPLDAGPSRTQPKATKRFNPTTGKIEVIK